MHVSSKHIRSLSNIERRHRYCVVIEETLTSYVIFLLN